VAQGRGCSHAAPPFPDITRQWRGDRSALDYRCLRASGFANLLNITIAKSFGFSAGGDVTDAICSPSPTSPDRDPDRSGQTYL